MKCEIAENASGAAIIVHCGPEETRVQFAEPKVDENGALRDEFEVCATLLEQAAAAIRAAAPPAGETGGGGEESDEAREARERRERFSMFTDPGDPVPLTGKPETKGYGRKAGEDKPDKPDKEKDEKHGKLAHSK